MLPYNKSITLIFVFLEFLLSIYFLYEYFTLPDEYSIYALCACLGWGLYAISNLYGIAFKNSVKKVFDDTKKDGDNKHMNDFENQYLK